MNQLNLKPLCFWSWNDDMDKDEVRLQVDELCRQGFGGFFIHARAGLKIPYLSDQWFELIEAVILQSKELGMDVYLYDEEGWPSGFAGGKVPELGEEYQFKKMSFCLAKDLPADGKLIAAYRARDDIYERVSDSALEDDILVAYYTADSHYVDLLYHDTAKKFIEFTHEQYKAKLGQYFGDVVKGIFTDEPQLMAKGYHWSVDLSEYFARVAGMDFIDNLWMLYVKDDRYQQFRYCYWKSLSEMYTERFTKVLFDWCEKNKLEFTGHFASEDGLCDQVYSLGSLMQNYEYMHIPGIDFLGKRLASPVLTKQVSGVAHQLDKKRVLSETYGCSGWDVRFLELAWIWNWQVMQGINLPCIHLSAYSIKGIRKRDYPAHFSYQEPWWDRFHYFSEWMDRINHLMSEGVKEHDVLLINPAHSIWCWQRNNECVQEVANISTQFRLIVENLIDTQIPFDLGDENLIGKLGYVQNGALHIGKCSYKTVILPEMSSLDWTTVQLLNEFVQSGGKLIFTNNRPYMVEGKKADLLSLGNFADIDIVCNRKELWAKYFAANQFKRNACVIDKTTDRLADTILVETIKTEYGYRLFLFNPSTSCMRKNLTVTFHGIYSIKQHTATSGSYLNVDTHTDGKNTFFDLELLETEMAVFEVLPYHSAENTNLRLMSDETLFLDDISLLNYNALTIDRANCYYNDVLCFDNTPVIRLYDDVYNINYKPEKSSYIKIEYVFYTAGLSKEELWLAAETENCVDVRINDHSLKGHACGFYIDKAIVKYPITEYLTEGKNIVSLYYNADEFKHEQLNTEVFETERNRFYHPVEIENIYILGMFDVSATDKSKICAEYYSVRSNRFTIVPLTEKCDGDLTPQGMWFYRGNISYSGELTLPEGCDRVMLSIRNPRCTFVTVNVNGNAELPLFQQPFAVDITEHLRLGKNKITLCAYGHNRNVLGPHHHYKGKVNFVGVHTFSGVRGFEDFINHDLTGDITWVDEYHFVPFHVGEVRVQFYREDHKK